MAGGQQRAGRPEGVAGSTTSPNAGSPDPAPEPDVQDDGPDLTHCADCGSEEVVYVTEDPAAEEKGYCKTHVPANVTPKMIEEQGRT